MLIPKTRHEYYLAVISGNDYPTFPPKAREEMYLAKLAGREVDVPNPKTPKERAYYNIINDIKFEPENRWQTFVAAANDDSITAPVPRTREEIWWSTITLSQEVIVEYIGSLPATLQTVEGYLESYKIYGNAVQDGTPTPENPVDVVGCGVKTENLIEATILDANISNNGQVIRYISQNVFNICVAKVEEGETYCFFNRTGPYGLYSSYPTIGTNSVDGTRHFESTITIPIGTHYIAVRGDYGADMMVVQGTTPPTSYEPYGYKLPLTANGVEHPIYLGEVQTTRKIKKHEFTGQETFYASSQTSVFYTTAIANSCNKTAIYNTGCIINAYKIRKQSTAANLLDGELTTDSNGFLWFRNYDYATLADFQSYLRQQYANGTPVTVWYVLATEETGIVNEPLMKIGDYADIIDNTQAGVQIPTAAGTTVIDYNGTPTPDKVELTYKTLKRAYISADDKVYQDPNGQLLGG